MSWQPKDKTKCKHKFRSEKDLFCRKCGMDRNTIASIASMKAHIFELESREARDEYVGDIAAAWDNYIRAKVPAWDKYDSARAAAFAKYRRATAALRRLKRNE